MSKATNNLILGECADTFADVIYTEKCVFEAGDLVMKILTGGSDIDN